MDEQWRFCDRFVGQPLCVIGYQHKKEDRQC